MCSISLFGLLTVIFSQLCLLEVIENKKQNQESSVKMKFKEYYSEISKIGSNLSTKNNSKINLVYFTPWNKKGSELVLKYAKKIDIVSPVWFDLKPEVLQGKYNTNVRKNYSNIKFAFFHYRLTDLITLIKKY